MKLPKDFGKMADGSYFGEVKQTNPKDILGSKRTAFNLLSAQVLGQMSLGMLEGACKYGSHNYRVAGVKSSVYISATIGHLLSWQEGQDIDEDSGLNHISKAMSSLHVLLDGIMNETLVDDRPPKVKNLNWKKDCDNQAKAIIEKYPNPVKPYTQI